MNQHERTAFFNFLETAVRQTDPRSRPPSTTSATARMRGWS